MPPKQTLNNTEMDTHTAHLVKLGKKLSYLLRHDKSYAFDEHGWREVSDLVANHGFTMEELREIVATNNKQRYEFSEDMTRIRARQGHSIQGDVELAEATPPDLLYHGTAKAFIGSIMKQLGTDERMCDKTRFAGDCQHRPGQPVHIAKMDQPTTRIRS